MSTEPTDPSSARHQWLQHIHAALDTAERVAGPLLLDPSTAADAAALEARLEQIRVEVMELEMQIDVKLSPEWMNLLAKSPVTNPAADHPHPRIRS